MWPSPSLGSDLESFDAAAHPHSPSGNRSSIRVTCLFALDPCLGPKGMQNHGLCALAKGFWQVFNALLLTGYARY